MTEKRQSDPWQQIQRACVRLTNAPGDYGSGSARGDQSEINDYAVKGSSEGSEPD